VLLLPGRGNSHQSFRTCPGCSTSGEPPHDRVSLCVCVRYSFFSSFLVLPPCFCLVLLCHPCPLTRFPPLAVPCAPPPAYTSLTPSTSYPDRQQATLLPLPTPLTPCALYSSHSLCPVLLSLPVPCTPLTPCALYSSHSLCPVLLSLPVPCTPSHSLCPVLLSLPVPCTPLTPCALYSSHSLCPVLLSLPVPCTPLTPCALYSSHSLCPVLLSLPVPCTPLTPCALYSSHSLCPVLLSLPVPLSPLTPCALYSSPCFSPLQIRPGHAHQLPRPPRALPRPSSTATTLRGRSPEGAPITDTVDPFLDNAAPQGLRPGFRVLATMYLAMALLALLYRI